jgi:hypothetical protein
MSPWAISGRDVLAAVLASVLLALWRQVNCRKNSVNQHCNRCDGNDVPEYPSTVLRESNGSRGCSVMSEGMLSFGPLVAGCGEAHNDCDRLERTVKKMYNKQASIKIVTAITL